MLKWELVSETSSLITYAKGEKKSRYTAHFDLEIKNVQVIYIEWISNRTKVSVPDHHPTRWSAKYGHFQAFPPTLCIEDLEWIYNKAKELFKEAE